jgi:hypothetical protein
MNRRGLLQALSALPFLGWLGKTKAIGVVDTAIQPEGELVVKCVEWHFTIGSHVATCSDGRLRVFDAEQSLTLPAPAAEIWKGAIVRKAIRVQQMKAIT